MHPPAAVGYGRGMPAEASLLSEVQLFERLNEEERALLAAQVEEERVAAGAHIFKKGDPGDAIFIVADGEVEIFVEDSIGQRIVFETAKRGDFFGELSLLDGDPRSASALALKETKLLRLDRDDLTLLFTKHPSAALDVLAVISRRLREADKLLGTRPAANANQVMEERLTVVDRIADTAAEFSGRFSFLVVHFVWFIIWIAINVGWTPIEAFDPFPFGLLTMIVSLEAIFLSCMVLISQNRQASKEKIRADVEYDANIRAGLEVTQLHVKIDALHEQLIKRMTMLERGIGPTSGARTDTSGVRQPPIL